MHDLEGIVQAVLTSQVMWGLSGLMEIYCFLIGIWFP